MHTQQILTLTLVAFGMFGLLGFISYLSHVYSLNGIRSRTVGDGQHGTARFATKQEIRQTYTRVPFDVSSWRKGRNLPQTQGIVVACEPRRGGVAALVDENDVHALMIGAAGVGKTVYFLYPNLEFACASGMSFLCLDTKGDLYRNYGSIAKEKYGFHVSVLDLRNPTRSDGNNLLHLVNRYTDEYKKTGSIAAKARAEKYAKITAKTIINAGGGDAASHGTNAYFYDAAEGLLTSVILLIAEFCPPEARHIVSEFKLIQDMLGPAGEEGMSQFQQLIGRLPSEHKARWFAGAALFSADQAMASVMSTALSRLNAFLDTELEQLLCFDTAIDAEQFCSTKSAVFVVLPEEDPSKYFMVSLLVQQLYREILSVADEMGGRLQKRVMFYLDEFGTIPRIESAEMMFSASRSRGISIVAIIQSLAQLEKNYGREGAEIILDNCQLTVFGGFAPNSQTAKVMSESLGKRTVLSGSVSHGRHDPSRSLQMIERPLATPDELKSMKKGCFIVMKTGCNPMQCILKLFTKWGITFGKPYTVEERAERKVRYICKAELEVAIAKAYAGKKNVRPPEPPTEHEKAGTTRPRVRY